TRTAKEYLLSPTRCSWKRRNRATRGAKSTPPMLTDVIRKIPGAVKLYRSIKPRRSEASTLGPSFRSILQPLGEPFSSQLESMYEGHPQVGSDGELHKMDAS